MKRFNHKLSIVLLLVLFSLLLADNISAQKRSNENKKSKRYYSDTYQKSSSLKSSATRSDYTDYHNKSIRKIDSNTKRDIKLSRKENESSENYFRIDKSGNSLWDGKHWEESRFPLNIYVKESSSRYYKSAYKDYIKYAMDVWKKADDRIQYKFVKNVDDADVALIFVENLGDEYEESYLGLTDYETYESNEISFSKIQISLIKNGDEKISAGEIKATIIHELGHAFGLGHSKNEKDLMYPYISPDHTSEKNYNELSNGDKLAIKDVINLSFDEKYVWK
jgi:predicted Zn-dependent protease